MIRISDSPKSAFTRSLDGEGRARCQEAEQLLAQQLRDKRHAVDRCARVLSAAIDTLPPLGRESEAKQRGLHFKVKYESIPGWFTACRAEQRDY